MLCQPNLRFPITDFLEKMQWLSPISASAEHLMPHTMRNYILNLQRQSLAEEPTLLGKGLENVEISVVKKRTTKLEEDISQKWSSLGKDPCNQL